VLENEYRLSSWAFTCFEYSQGFVFQGRSEWYLGFFEGGSTFKTRIYYMKIHVDHVFSHAVPLRTIPSITVQ